MLSDRINIAERDLSTGSSKPNQENSSSEEEIKELKAKLKVMTTKF